MTDDIVYEGELGPICGFLDGRQVVLCDRTACVFNLPWVLDDGVEHMVCGRPKIEWAEGECQSFHELNEYTEFGDGVVKDKHGESLVSQKFIEKVPVVDEVFSYAFGRMGDLYSRLMADDMKNRGPLPEDMDGSWIGDYYDRGDEAILDPQSKDDVLLERSGRRKLLGQGQEPGEKTDD